MKAIEQIAGILLMSRDSAHKAHLATGSYAQHVALDGFYSSLLGFFDSFVESAQGKYGILDIPEMDDQKDFREPIAMLEDHLNKITKLSTRIEDSFLKNILDEITALYYQTLYKLKYLS